MNSLLSRRSFIRLSATGSAAGLLGWAGHAQVPQAPTPAPAPRSKSGAEHITHETEEAIREGLDFLARNQLSDGSFCNRRDYGGAAAGITSLAALALMAGGNQPNRGKYGKEVSRAADFITSLANGPTPGFLSTATDVVLGARMATTPGPMYSHGFSTLFLSEVCGMLPNAGRDNKIRSALEQAVAFTVGAKNNEGGWRYVPRPDFADVSVTVAQMMALRAAKHAGILVRKDVIDAGAGYIKACQMPDGGFSYWKGQGYSAFARTAASIVGLYSAGVYEGKEIERGLKYLQQFTPGRQFSPREIPPQHYWYGQYYAALAMWTAGDDYWTPWFPAIRDELLGKRRASGGNWSDPYHGAPYATAMALIILQLPNNYLPILQK